VKKVQSPAARMLHQMRRAFENADLNEESISGRGLKHHKPNGAFRENNSLTTKNTKAHEDQNTKKPAP
jgi:hypothetical protein